MEKVSVIIPVYNAEKYLKNTLNSILKQTYTDLKIIAINDGSIDSSLEILLDFQQKYGEKVKVVDITNGGPGRARNVGIEMAQGNFITFVDSDDTIESNMIEVMINKINETSSDICICGMNFIRNGEVKKYNIKDGEICLHEYLLSDIMATPCNKIYRKNLFDNVKFDSTLSFEDLEIIPKLCIIADKIVGVNECFYNYFQRENSRNTIRVKSAFDVVTVVNNIIEFYKFNGKYETYHDELEYIAVYHTIGSKAVGISRIKEKSKKREILNAYYTFLNENFIEWDKNKYIMNLSLKHKLILTLFKNKLYFLLDLILNIK